MNTGDQSNGPAAAVDGAARPQRPCLLCGKLLEPVRDDWKTYQPYGGGEVQFIFAYGSMKFDDRMGCTVFKAIVCDDCAEKHVPQMDYMTE